MLKSELINRVAEQVNQLSAKDIELAINHILDRMADTLSRGERIEIRNFGTFSVHHREARVAFNPKTGESVPTIAKYVPHFKPGKQLRERVNTTFGQPIKGLKDLADDADD